MRSGDDGELANGLLDYRPYFRHKFTASQLINNPVELHVGSHKRAKVLPLVCFTHPLDLSNLDGIVMANSLHFVRNKAPVLELVRGMLRPGGKLIVVEYGTDRGNPWVPHPFTYEQWERMAAQAGFERTRLLRTIPSRHTGSMYSAVSET